MSSTDSISTLNTILPRHLAAIADNLVAMVLGIVAAKMFDEDLRFVHAICMVTVYLCYYFVFEAVLSRTPGKLLTGLVVVRKNGTRASIRDVAIRTAFRIIEVNPLLLGGIPAALSIVFSVDNQRFGDKVAGTIVVPSSRVRRFLRERSRGT